MYAAVVYLVPASVGGVERVFFVTAEQVEWNYGDAPDSFEKARFVGYEDASWKTRRPDNARPPYMGLLGPTLRACVGDTMRVMFNNRLGHPASLHPHGVGYSKDSEGATYGAASGAKGTAASLEGMGASILPGKTFTYRWNVPESAGPGPEEGAAKAWLYHSHAPEQAGMAAGLAGIIVINSRAECEGAGEAAGRADVEAVTLFATYDESKSMFEPENSALPQLHRTVNGYAAASAPEPLELAQGQRVRWFAGALGTNDEDLHTMHWHGQTGVTSSGERTDTLSVQPGELKQLEFIVRGDPGDWMLHCHVSEHTEVGMAALVRVVEGRDPAFNDDPRPDVKDARALHLGSIGLICLVVGGGGLAYKRFRPRKVYRKARGDDLELNQNK